MNDATPRLGISGRIAGFFQSAQITPLLALVALLLGLFAVLVTPREEEPQIDVTMANVLIPFPGATAKDAETMVAQPAEQVLSQIAGIEHVMSVSRPGIAMITIQFQVGVPRTEALVRLHDTLAANRDWLPPGLGVGEPIVKPKGIDDVPIVTLTLHSTREDVGAAELERVAHAMEGELKRVRGTREVKTLGAPRRAINIRLDPARMQAHAVTVADLRATLQSANAGMPLGQTIAGDRAVAIEAGHVLRDAADVADLVVAVRGGRPVFLADVAEVDDGPPPAERYVWYGTAADAQPVESAAVTIQVTKKPGENAVDVARRVLTRVDTLRGTLIPDDVQVTVTRNYGETADDKAMKLIQKLVFATASVVVLVWLALGWREAGIVGAAVVLTLTATLFASWAWGFTLNRVSLFALIFSIGILVDDAIVVVENIHRHRGLKPGETLAQIIPGAVDEVGGPTILATLTVIAALLPMAFVSGLMGPYMSPIPINASMGMLISLAVAFVVTPWLSRRWLRKDALGHAPGHAVGQSGVHGEGRLDRLFGAVFGPFLDARRGGVNRLMLWIAIVALIAVSVALPVFQRVVLKMLPFDDKSEFQVVVDMPAGTPVERTATVLRELTGYLATVPEVANWQAYAGLASPINFNGLVRQYDLRQGGEVGDLQVNLVDKHARSDKSHSIALRLRPALARIGAKHGARVKVVEVPPGPPVMSPIVAEVYGPDDTGRNALAREVRKAFAADPDIVDIDDSTIADAPKKTIVIDRRKAAAAGVPPHDIVATLRAGLAGDEATWLRDRSKYPAAARLQLPVADQADLDALLKLPVRTGTGATMPVRELVRVEDTTLEQPILHKDLLPVTFVVADMAGKRDSPLYGVFGLRKPMADLVAPDGGPVTEYWISQPEDSQRGYAIKWDGESQITYETFRDMGAAYAVGLVLIYLLVVAQFGSYRVPLIIMAPIPLTIIGVMPGHALLGAQFTATSMIGMIALAGIIVRNSILLIDFIELQLREGMPLARAVVSAAATRAQPITLTGLAAMLGAFFILDDPIFNGLAISLIFGILVSTMLTLIVIPLLYYTANRRTAAAVAPSL